MARWIARQAAGMQRHPLPCQPLGVGHRRIVVRARVMIGVLLENREDSIRSVMAGLARRYGGNADPHAVAKDRRDLSVEIDVDKHWPVRRELRRPHPFPWLELVLLAGQVERLRLRRALRERR